MKVYLVNGKRLLYREGEQPIGAIEEKPAVKPAEKAVEAPKTKMAKPANKARAVRKK